MTVTAIELDNMAVAVTVVLDGKIGRKFEAATLKASDIEGFLADAERATATVRTLRRQFMESNVVPFVAPEVH